MDLNNKVCIVTGGAKGIGFAIAKCLSDYGAKVIIADIDEAGALNAAAKLKGESFGIACDISDVSQVSMAITEIWQKFRRIDVLVNNAGILQTTVIDEITEEEWDHVMGVNLKSAFFTSQKVLKYMRLQNFGRIINISSLAGRNGGFETGCAYSASKAGMIGMTRNIARKMAPFGITVNAIAPGTVESDLSKQFSEDAMKSILSNIPVNRLGKPEEISEIVAFLASDHSGFITGAVIDVNGGMFMG
ncbi:MAG: SDR family NAD(P)-dependent oxidoreductase [Saccharofermentanales bacterium]